MESYGVLPADKLKIWTIFRNVGVEGEEILKRAKLVHVHDKEGFVVTKTDETYHFIHGGLGDAKIDRIPELCRVRVKEFIIGAINLAITEDGRLYSWCSELRSADTPIEEQTEQLGRSASGDGVYTPTQVQCGAAIHKIRQVALLGIGEGRVLALTVLGDVYHWATVRYKPTPIDKRQSNGRKVISVGCCAAAYFALSESGEIFRIGPQALEQLEVNVGGIPVKKIATTQTTICALTLDGKVHSWRLQGSWGQIEQMRIPLVAHFKDVQDIKTCWMEDVCIVEVKGNLRFACYLGIRMDVIVPYSSVPMEECIAQIGQKSYRTMIVGPIKEATKRTLGDSLWRNKGALLP
ncbi:RCC1 and BTB domain-containing protein 1 [Folsomia candida]|uniref:RCC1 and BTB domain-containing protein 1 n=1 Tax=Folsomia candida TaxID=158441 RepID=A0A226CYC5_FOLCA|nr:RCC1 and BTB domain-containing protein 1 [Folsomia candida]